MSPGNHRDPLPAPPHFNPDMIGEVWRVIYPKRAAEAADWARKFEITSSKLDEQKIALIGIDIQNTFCIPDYELFVAGRSGNGAVDDNRRLCEFIYRYLGRITKITATLDTHTAMQIFHPIFIVDIHGHHPEPLSSISYDDIRAGKWMFNSDIAASLGITPDFGQQHLLHYTKELHERGKFDLTVWPYHSMLGGIGHALVSAFEEAVFFHTIVRKNQTDFDIKGSNPLTEHYSALGPEVLDGPRGKKIGRKSKKFLQTLEEYDAVIIAGQAKSHCVAWTIEDLLGDILEHNPKLVRKVYLLEDCTSPVVVSGVVDYTEVADEAFKKFANAGMHVVRSTEPLDSWLI